MVSEAQRREAVLVYLSTAKDAAAQSRRVLVVDEPELSTLKTEE